MESSVKQLTRVVS
ncbi:Protein of unknown function [Bacillus mycoides]|uniref:Uncharacterized protein n=1 Tax=Bacillus mycoides TaxID=1405 RepID=A0A1D3MIY6_BACMY|nr:Protein of unknown function [Bacillus mycoides]SCM85922.1 Protein of unknown function [Bacillus mycoides]